MDVDVTTGQLAAADEAFAPDLVFHSPIRPTAMRGPDELKAWVTRLRTGFPDIRITIEEIFANRGERVFRDGERRVIARLLAQPVHVLATGGGAFMHPATRELVARRGVSLWLRADLEVLVSRVLRRSNRPLLKQGDARAILTELIERRYPLYAEADVVVDSGEGSPEATVTRAIAALAACPRAMLPPEG